MAKCCEGAWEREVKALVVLQGQAPGEAPRGHREPRLEAGLGSMEATQPCWSCEYRIWRGEEGNGPYKQGGGLGDWGQQAYVHGGRTSEKRRHGDDPRSLRTASFCNHAAVAHPVCVRISAQQGEVMVEHQP